MKIIVDKLPRYFYVEDDCLFAQKTGEMIGGKDWSTLEECRCKISGYTCELQRYDECPYLKKLFDQKDNDTFTIGGLSI